MKCAAIILAIATLGAAGAGAWYWWRSSKVAPVPTWLRYGGTEPADATSSQMGWLAGLLEAAREAAALNKLAAMWTGCAAVLGAATTIAGLFAS